MNRDDAEILATTPRPASLGSFAAASPASPGSFAAASPASLGSFAAASPASPGSFAAASKAAGGERMFRRRGFTLIELLMVILVIGVLIGILLPALAGARRNARKRQASVEMRAIKTAVVAYHLEHRNWPLPAGELDPAISARESYSNENYLIVGILTGSKPPYLDSSHFRFDGAGNALDPWGKEYVVEVDKNYDGSPDQAEVSSTTPERW